MAMEWIAPLASGGAGALVAAAATDAWTTSRTRFARILGRGRPDEAAATEDALDRLNEAVAAQPDAAAREAERVRQQVVWQARLAAVLTEDPGAAEELRVAIVKVVEEAAAAAAAERRPIVEQRNEASGNGQVNATVYGAQTIHHHTRPPSQG